MQQSEERQAGPGWAGARVAAVLSHSQPGAHQAHQGSSQGHDLAGQLLALQLQRLALGHQVPNGNLSGGHFRHASPPGSSSWGGSSGSPHPPLDPSLLGSGMLARLQMGAGVPAGMPGLAPGSAGAGTAAAAAVAQQQQQQQQAPAGRRRGGASGPVARRNEEKVRRTIYISDISEACSEAQLAGFFRDCGQLVDVRVCGDPNSSMRFAFIEFTTEDSAVQALRKSGNILGDFPIRVSPSKTAIVPVNNTYLPRSSEERELVARTVFVGNIDRVVQRDQLCEFFGNLCGPVSKIRLLGESQHNSKIAFIEFATAESARAALKLSGALLGTLPLRVSPSKTPVRAEQRRSNDGHALPVSMPLGVPAVPAGMPLLPAALGASLHSAALPQQAMGHHAQLPPALLMAVAGLQMYPGSGFG
ncbi:hypothetical protein ABPG75_013428 [Micractinium tetrahymenae]